MNKYILAKSFIQKFPEDTNELNLDGDDECKNIVVVTILEYLGDDKEVLKKALDYLELELREESRRVESFLGRN